MAHHLQNQERQLEFLSEDLASRYEEIDLLYTITEILGRTGRFEEAAASILAAVAEAVQASGGLIAMTDGPGEAPRVVARRESSGGHGAQAGEASLSVPIRSTRGADGPRHLGVLTLTPRSEGGRFSASEQKIVAAAANQIAVAIALSRMLEQERDLKLARDLQRLLMPSPAVLRNDAEVAARCIPTEAVGGDFYTFNRLGLGVIAVMLGDVASHGFPAALVMAAVMAAAGIQAGSGASPDVTLRSLHQNLGERLSFAETYLTVFYGILDPERGLLSWASAGHPYAFRVPRTGPAERLEVTAPPLGLGEVEDISARSIPWDREGDLLCLWTDGLVDASAASGERFGERRLIEVLEGSRAEPAEVIVSRVMMAVDGFAPAPHDDRTLLVLRL